MSRFLFLYYNRVYVKILVFNGSFAPPVLKAEIAVLWVTPQSSKIIAPLAIFETQWLTDPFPFPIRTSVGFAVIGKLGKTRIQSLPLRFILRFIACLAASICLEERTPDSIDFNPIVPNCNLFDRNSSFEIVPFRIFLYFDLFGCKNII